MISNQEFTVSTSQYSAEYGNSSGGVVNFTVKTDTNDFHGEGYLFVRNEAFNARPDFNRIIGQARPQDRQQEYGFTIGGPVFLPRFGEGGRRFYNGRNRIHFFFNYGGYRIDQQENVALSVPSLKMRQGDFSELLTDPEVRRFFGAGGVQIFNPYQRPGQREVFAGNIIPQNLLDPVGVAFVNLFPLPNQTGPNGSTVHRNYAATTVASARTNYYVGKVTQLINNKQTLNVSYIYRKLPSQKGGAPRFDAPFVALGRWQQQFQSYYARLQHDWTITPARTRKGGPSPVCCSARRRMASTSERFPDHLWNPQMRNWGYQTYQNKDDYLKALRHKIEALAPMKQRLGVSAAVYTQTTDVEGEVNGLMTYDRKFIKVDPAMLREMNASLTGGK